MNGSRVCVAGMTGCSHEATRRDVALCEPCSRSMAAMGYAGSYRSEASELVGGEA